jgi:methylenetetrahydrofolate reductase (NADPH)
MQLAEAYESGRFGLSFELFPPKTAAGERALFEQLRLLLETKPSYVTCTYGAGGSTRAKTLEIVERVKRDFGVPVASHLTCVGSTVAHLREYLRDATARGVNFVVALRGDPPQGTTQFEAVAGGFRNAHQLVALMRAEFPQFGIAVGGYPEKHLEAPSLEVDLAHLKHKVDAGADVVITQLFYRNADFHRFRDRCEQIGVRVPIIPGILPVTNLAQIQRITSLCGAYLPPTFVRELGKRDDPDWQFQVGVEFATRQVQELLDADVPGLHFYVLNRSQATSQVLRAITFPKMCWRW